MKRKNGFTLTEVLLAVMIVGIIGVALASLTTAASRESGVGNSRVMLRNNLSVALRQLRQDVHEASRILYVPQAPLSGSAPTTATPLLVLAKNEDLDGTKIIEGEDHAQVYVAYCFTAGNKDTLSSGSPVQPESYATDGGSIERRVSTNRPTTDYCCTATSSSEDYCTSSTTSPWLHNVKFISNDYANNDHHYPVPLFELSAYKTSDGLVDEADNVDLTRGAVLKVNVIVELPSNPVVNEVVEERLLLSNGGGKLPQEP